MIGPHGNSPAYLLDWGVAQMCKRSSCSRDGFESKQEPKRSRRFLTKINTGTFWQASSNMDWITTRDATNVDKWNIYAHVYIYV